MQDRIVDLGCEFRASSASARDPSRPTTCSDNPKPGDRACRPACSRAVAQRFASWHVAVARASLLVAPVHADHRVVRIHPDPQVHIAAADSDRAVAKTSVCRKSCTGKRRIEPQPHAAELGQQMIGVEGVHFADVEDSRSPLVSTHTFAPTSPLPSGIEPNESALGEFQVRLQSSRQVAAWTAAAGAF